MGFDYLYDENDDRMRSKTRGVKGKCQAYGQFVTFFRYAYLVSTSL